MNISETKWRFIDTGFNDPYMNMAIDDSIAQLLNDNDLPVLRFFDWTQPAISIGYSQKINDVINTSLLNRESVSFVRRPTGGGVVFHGVDITYSCILPKKNVKNINDAYKLVQQSIIKGINFLGVKSTMYENIEKTGVSCYCYIKPNYGDIMLDGRKLGGIAARRIKGKLLFQGYIYSGNASEMFRFCKLEHFPEYKAVSLDVLNLKKDIVKHAINKNWPFMLEPGFITDKEKEVAGILADTKYSLSDWNFRR